MSYLFVKLRGKNKGVAVYRKHDNGMKELLRSFTPNEILNNEMHDFLEQQPEYIAILEREEWKDNGLSPELEYKIEQARKQNMTE